MCFSLWIHTLSAALPKYIVKIPQLYSYFGYENFDSEVHFTELIERKDFILSWRFLYLPKLGLYNAPASKQHHNSPAVWAGLIPIPSAGRQTNTPYKLEILSCKKHHRNRKNAYHQFIHNAAAIGNKNNGSICNRKINPTNQSSVLHFAGGKHNQERFFCLLCSWLLFMRTNFQL